MNKMFFATVALAALILSSPAMAGGNPGGGPNPKGPMGGGGGMHPGHMGGGDHPMHMGDTGGKSSGGDHMGGGKSPGGDHMGGGLPDHAHAIPVGDNNKSTGDHGGKPGDHMGGGDKSGGHDHMAKGPLTDMGGKGGQGGKGGNGGNGTGTGTGIGTGTATSNSNATSYGSTANATVGNVTGGNPQAFGGSSSVGNVTGGNARQTQITNVFDQGGGNSGGGSSFTLVPIVIVAGNTWGDTPSEPVVEEVAPGRVECESAPAKSHVGMRCHHRGMNDWWTPKRRD
jgi:hypothetical protein